MRTCKKAREATKKLKPPKPTYSDQEFDWETDCCEDGFRNRTKEEAFWLDMDKIFSKG